MTLKPLDVADLAEAVLGCACAALEATAVTVPGQPGCPDCRACVVPGTAAWDTCDSPATSTGAGGQLTVNVARLYASTRDAFPVEVRAVQGLRGCLLPPLTAVELVITLLRCAPTADEQGVPPDCAALAATAQTLHVDMATLYNSLLCCLPGLDPSKRLGALFVMGVSRTIGPEGGCVGVEQRVTVALPGCACPTT